MADLLPALVGAWSAPKGGSDPGENDDACVVRRFSGAAGETGWFCALSDGAASSIYSGRWARALTEGARPDWPGATDEALGRELDAVRSAFRPLPPDASHYVEAKYRLVGSQATLLVATLVARGGRLVVDALAVGDTCLLLSRPDGGLSSFPILRASEFAAAPELIKNHERGSPAFKRWSGELRPGERLLCATDALSHWALAGAEVGAGRLVLDGLASLTPGVGAAGTERSARAFEALVRAARSAETGPTLRNDDATLAVFSAEAAPPPACPACGGAVREERRLALGLERRERGCPACARIDVMEIALPASAAPAVRRRPPLPDPIRVPAVPAAVTAPPPVPPPKPGRRLAAAAVAAALFAALGASLRVVWAPPPPPRLSIGCFEGRLSERCATSAVRARAGAASASLLDARRGVPAGVELTFYSRGFSGKPTAKARVGVLLAAGWSRPAAAIPIRAERAWYLSRGDETRIIVDSGGGFLDIGVAKGGPGVCRVFLETVRPTCRD